MKKVFIAAIICIFITLMLISILNKETKSTNDTVDIWYYVTGGNKAMLDHMSDYMEIVGNKEGINVKIHRVTENDMSIDDYILKRNLAVQLGEADILFGYPDTFYSIKDRCDDYSKLSTYDNILPNLRGSFVLPIMSNPEFYLADKDVFELYGVSVDDVITFDEYYDYKLIMKENGAKFKINYREFNELLDYHIRKNAIHLEEKDGNMTINKDLMDKTIHDICTELSQFYDYFSRQVIFNEEETTIIDDVTGRALRDYDYHYYICLKSYADTVDQLNQFEYDDYNGPKNYCAIINNRADPISVFINRSENDNKYRLVASLYDDDFFKFIPEVYYRKPVTDTQYVRKYMQFGENWKYNGPSEKNCYGDIDTKGLEIFNECYKMIRNFDYKYEWEQRNMYIDNIYDFVLDEVLDTMENPQHTDQFNECFNDLMVKLNVMHE